MLDHFQTSLVMCCVLFLGLGSSPHRFRCAVGYHIGIEEGAHEASACKQRERAAIAAARGAAFAVVGGRVAAACVVPWLRREGPPPASRLLRIPRQTHQHHPPSWHHTLSAP